MLPLAPVRCQYKFCTPESAKWGQSLLLTRIAQQLRRQTPMSRQWIADRLRIGSATYVSNLLSTVDRKL